MTSSPRRLRFKAVIVDSKPPIWRTIDIDPSLTLDALHDVLQIAFGWQDYHLHVFETARPYGRLRPGQPEPKQYGPPSDEDDDPFGFAPTTLDETRQRIARFLSEATSPVYYLYDFGDDWLVRLEFVESRRAVAGEPTVAIVKAKLRGPTEDSGGIWGWQEKRRILDDPTHPEHADIAEWVREVDAERFPVDDVVDLDDLNDQLGDLFEANRPLD